MPEDEEQDPATVSALPEPEEGADGDRQRQARAERRQSLRRMGTMESRTTSRIEEARMAYTMPANLMRMPTVGSWCRLLGRWR